MLLMMKQLLSVIRHSRFVTHTSCSPPSMYSYNNNLRCFILCTWKFSSWGVGLVCINIILRCWQWRITIRKRDGRWSSISHWDYLRCWCWRGGGVGARSCELKEERDPSSRQIWVLDYHFFLALWSCGPCRTPHNQNREVALTMATRTLATTS